MSRLLLLSTSTVYGTGYLEHASAELREHLPPGCTILFVPFARRDHDAYAAMARRTFQEMGFGLESLHVAADPQGAVRAAQAFFVGGGNTFRLLKALQDRDLLAPIRERVMAGAPYAGASAGSNLACPTIGTTNDMPICFPRSWEALNLVPFQINPHYLDADPDSRHMGETREQRILEYHEENERPVIGLREGAVLKVEDGVTWLLGAAGARWFRKGCGAVELQPSTGTPVFRTPARPGS